MKYAFDEELHMIKREFDAEKEFMSTKHENQINDLKDIYVAFDKHFLQKETEARNEYGSTRDEMKNKSLEDKHGLRIVLEKKVNVLWAEYTQCQANYNRATEERRSLFETLKARDEQSVVEIERQMIRLREINAKIAAAKAKRNRILEEFEEKNTLLREEREKLGIHFMGLKAQINQLHEKQHVKLTKMAIIASDVRKKMDELNKRAEQIIQIGEDCRKLETEEEKVLPFYASCLSQEEEEKLANEIQDSEDQNVKVLLKQYAPLELFWRRFNKVQLDRLALLKERDVLTNQNDNLKHLLTQYLDGLSVNDEILAKPNSLFVVNGRSNLNPNPLIKDARVRPVATVKLEALHIYKDSVTSGLLEK
ncbi:Dynein regulatory complex subunit 2 [Sparganum proliferum]